MTVDFQMTIARINTTPYQDQKPGTSGLRKRVKVFQQPHYTQNFIQAILSAIPDVHGSVLIVGGDGRYYSKTAIQMILEICAGNMVSKVIVGKDGILSTPAASHLIRQYKATGGILLTASHNPGGPDNDFGIKYNISNGGPAPESVTEKIYKLSTQMTDYLSADLPTVDLSTVSTHTFGDFTVQVVDSVSDYVSLMKEIYDFDEIKSFFQSNKEFKVLFDSMHGVTGPYAQRILVDELGLPESFLMNYVPLEDFGGGHPDPNLTYAHELVERVEAENVDLGIASDGDGDRNMILGKNCFVNPSDSVAVIASYAHIIPYFKKTGIKGLARSMPTSAAIDRVAHSLGVNVYEVPTGWKFFGNLMDAGKLSICGEESFGTGSDHIREKDGIWAVLAWMSILAFEYKSNPQSSLSSILTEFYKKFGRNYFSRYDYEEVDAVAANKMMENLRSKVASEPLSIVGSTLNGYQVVNCDDFEYKDPIDGSISKKQGLRILFKDGSRIIFRLSGTGSQGATIRLYVEKYSPKEYELNTQEAIQDLIDIALAVSDLPTLTGRSEPTVIT